MLSSFDFYVLLLYFLFYNLTLLLYNITLYKNNINSETQAIFLLLMYFQFIELLCSFRLPFPKMSHRGPEHEILRLQSELLNCTAYT